MRINYNIELFQRVLPTEVCIKFSHEEGVVFLDEIEQVAERLGGHRIPGEFLARLVAFRPKKRLPKVAQYIRSFI